MDQLERLYLLIAVADDILERQEQGENMDEQAIIVADLIGREIQSGTDKMCCRG